MRTPTSTKRSLAALLAVAAIGFIPTRAPAQDPTSNNVPVIRIRASVAETREPFCDPAICDAAPPAPGVFVVSRHGGDLARELFVSLGYAGTATGGKDYPALPEFVTFRAGQASVELLVAANYDRMLEGIETVVAQVLPDPTMGPIERYRVDAAQASARVAILDNETPPEPRLSIVATSPIAEESSFPYRRLALRGRFTISRTGSTAHETHVFVLTGGTAVPGVDYVDLPWLVTIPAGTNQIELEVVPKTDDRAEPIETVEATLSDCPPLTDPPLGMPCYGVNIDPAHASARVFIRDDGITTASLDITAPKNGAEISEGSPIRIAATAIDLEGAITHVDFFDEDRKIGESTIAFIQQPDPGTPIDHEFEWRGALAGGHVLTTRALNAAGNAITSAPVRIQVGPGLPVISIEATGPETAEPSPTTRVPPGVFTLRRTGDASKALRVWLHYHGTATSGADYSAPPTVAEFAAGAAKVEVLIVPLADELVEGDETVIAEIAPSPLGIPPTYRIDPGHHRARVVIHDSTWPSVPVVSIRALQPATTEPLCPPNTCAAPEPAPGVFVISRRGGDMARALNVFLRSGGSALPRLDYIPLPEQVEIPAGWESVELFVTAAFDELAEGEESVVAALLPDPSLGPVGQYRIDLTQAAARVVIHDRTPPMRPVVTLLTLDPFAREGEGDLSGGNTATLVVTRAGATNDPLEVLFRLGGTAVNGEDYAALTSPLLIPAGQRSVRIVIRPIDDKRPEPVESVVVTLLENDGATPGYVLGRPSRGAAIIVDNDHPRPKSIRLHDGGFNVCVPVNGDHCFRVETTRDFKLWTPVCTVQVNDGMAHYVDSDAPNGSHQFYRLVPAACAHED